jgi:hypothetical protein
MWKILKIVFIVLCCCGSIAEAMPIESNIRINIWDPIQIRTIDIVSSSYIGITLSPYGIACFENKYKYKYTYIYNGEVLDVDCSFDDYEIKNGDTIIQYAAKDITPSKMRSLISLSKNNCIFDGIQDFSNPALRQEMMRLMDLNVASTEGSRERNNWQMDNFANRRQPRGRPPMKTNLFYGAAEGPSCDPLPFLF